MGHKLNERSVMNRKSAFTILFIAGIAISGCGNDDSEKAKQAINDMMDRRYDEAWCDKLRELGRRDLYAENGC